MPLHLQSHQKELDQLAEAFDQIRSRQKDAKSADYWCAESRRTHIINQTLSQLKTLKRTGLRILLGHLETTACLTHSLIEVTASAEGKKFWTNQTESLLGLADLIEGKLSQKITKKILTTNH